MKPKNSTLSDQWTPKEESFDLLKKLENISEKNVSPQSTKTFSEQLQKTSLLKKSNAEGEETALEENSDRYEILKTLGEGGMGVVQLVRDHLLGREVALKRLKLNPSFPRNAKTQKHLLWRLKREAHITAILEHPNIVPLYEMQSNASGEIQFTMRKIEGQTLREIFQELRHQKSLFDSKQLLSIFLKVCDAVGYAHSKGIIHRDLKPENIMVGNYGEVYVMDWGIAKVLKEIEFEPEAHFSKNQNPQTQGGIGTYGYMSPEQSVEGKPLTPQADIYSLGKILKECFIFVSPIEEFRQLLEYHQQNKNLILAGKNVQEDRQLPKDIVAIVEKAIQEKAEDRYSHTKDLAKDVEKYLQNAPISAREYGFLELAKKYLLRNRQKIILIGMILFVALIVECYGQWKKHQEEDNQYQMAIIESYRSKEKAESNAFEHGDQVKNWLSALYYVDKALEFRKELALEKHKLDIGIALKKLCFESKDYQLANYIAQKMGELQILKEEEKTRWKNEVQDEQGKVLKQHQETLNGWIQKFKEGTLKEGERSDALFEISKMEEKPVLEKLLHELQAGTQYYLEEQKKNVNLEDFYPFIAEVIARIENPEASQAIWESLEKIVERLASIEPEKRNWKEEEYAISLARALGTLKASKFGNHLREVRYKMGPHFNFWKQTQLAYQKLIEGTIQSLDQEIRSAPDKAVTYNARGLTKNDKGDWEGAIHDFNQAILLNPKESHYYHNRGITKYAKKDFEGAIHDFNQAIQLNPNLETAFTSRGVVKYLQGNLEGAINDLNRAIQLDPNGINAYKQRGIVASDQEEWEKALSDFNFILQKNPNFSEAYYYRGVVQFNKNNWKGAINDFNQAILLNPNEASYYHYRGIAQFNDGDYNSAFTDFNQSIQRNAEYIEAYYYRGKTKYFLGEWESALIDFNKVVQKNPNYKEVLLDRGKAKIKKGELAEALEDFNKAIQLDVNYAEAYYQRARIQIQKEEWKSVIQDLNETLRISPNYKEAYIDRGTAKAKLEQLTSALEDFHQALQIDPKESLAYYNSAVLFEITKEKEKAISFYEQGLSLKYSPKYHQDYLDLLLEVGSQKYRRKEYEAAQLLLKKFCQSAPPEHPKRPQVEKVLQEMEKTE